MKTGTRADYLRYKIVCISLYDEDRDRLRGLVALAKKRGCSKANASAVIRFALEQLDPSLFPRALR